MFLLQYENTKKHVIAFFERRLIIINYDKPVDFLDWGNHVNHYRCAHIHLRIILTYWVVESYLILYRKNETTLLQQRSGEL